MLTSELEHALLTQLNTLSLKPDATIYVALSGGLDSACLLHALWQVNLKNPLPQRICVLHVHHGLSANADHWLNFCAQKVSTYGFEFQSEKVILSGQGSIEDQARESRYGVFKNYLTDADVVLMAHHSDDQVETFMMRLMRGSGLTGLSAMESKRDLGKGELLRPWLHVSRKELEHYKKQNHIEHIEDESNADASFDRNWWRHHLLPTLNKRFSQSQTSILKTIDVLQQEHDLLQELLEPIYLKTIIAKQAYSFSEHASVDIAVMAEQSHTLRQQILRLWLAKHNIYPRLNSKQLQKIWSEVALAKADANPKFVWQGHEIRRYQNQLFILNTLPNETNVNADSQNRPFTGESIKLTLGELVCGPCDKSTAQGLIQGDYELAFYQGGLKAKPLGQQTKNLKKWMMAHNIPPWLRPFWPLLLKDGQVACVPGLFVCEGFAANAGSQPDDKGWQLDFILSLPKK